jgi:hypothetical protein
MLYDIFAPKLYHSCHIGHLSSLLVSLENGNEMLSKIQHLQLYSGMHHESQTYADFMIRNSWAVLDPPPKRGEHSTYHQEFEVSILIGLFLRHAVERGVIPFPALRMVSLGGHEDFKWIDWRDWRTPFVGGSRTHDDQYDDAFGIPQVIIGLPSVEHICQSVVNGPFALSPAIHIPKTPVKTFTYHARYPSDGCTCNLEYIPIIKGAVNRYYFVNAYTLIHTDGSPWIDDSGIILNALFRGLNQTSLRLSVSEKNRSHSAQIDANILDDTVIELYDYFRFVDPVEGDSLPLRITRGHSAQACRPAKPLPRFQQELDELLPDAWRDKVILKNREDAPLCAACGFDLVREWENKIEQDGLGNGDETMCPIHGEFDFVDETDDVFDYGSDDGSSD